MEELKKILITGGNGMLAKDSYELLQQDNKTEVIKLNKELLDITNPSEVSEVINHYHPDCVLHAAALTNVDLCEEDRKTAFNVNGYGTENIAYHCAKKDIQMVYISTCGLFGDEFKEYTESDDVVLKTEYSKSKYLGEEKVRELCRKYFIVRPGWLFGGSKKHKKNFVYKRYKEAMSSSQLKSSIDKYGCPTYTYDLAKKINELISTDCYGTYHISNQGYTNRYGYINEIIKLFGLNTQVIESDSSAFKRSAPVPDCEVIKNNNLVLKGFELIQDWEAALEEYIFRLKKEL